MDCKMHFTTRPPYEEASGWWCQSCSFGGMMECFLIFRYSVDRLMPSSREASVIF
ncbi:MAG: hypothetical protein H6Q57_1843, partial [Geobacteraceae bacterium]|nr:hypothetical protein [Geobacteraceae bacterium]